MIVFVIALQTNQIFPYVRVPAFETHAYEARKQAWFEIVEYAPVAYSAQDWVAFSLQNVGWLDESKRIYDELEPGLNRSQESPTLAGPSVVLRMNRVTDQFEPWMGSGTFYPKFHTSPPPPADKPIAFQNLDLFSIPEYKAVSLAAVAVKGKRLGFTFLPTRRVF
jgi:hypothetical protein